MGNGTFTENAKARGDALRLFDWLSIISAFLIAHVIRFGNIQFTSAEFAVALLFVLVCRFSLTFCGCYEQWRGTRIVSTISQLLLAVGFTTVTIVFGAFAIQSSATFSRIWFGIGAGVCFLLLSMTRIAIHYQLTRARKTGKWQRNLIIAGAGSTGQAIVRKIANESSLGIVVVGYFDDNESLVGSTLKGVPVLGTLDDMYEFIERRRGGNASIDYVWLTIPLTAHKRSVEVVSSLSDTTARISVVPDYNQLLMYNCRLDAVLDIPLLDISDNQVSGSGVLIKEVLDRVSSAVLVLLALPLLCLIAIAIKLDSPGPVLFAQRRYGMDGREIKVLKFRSMVVLEDTDLVAQAVRGDKRVTRVGAFLRKSSLDELPQLLNVLKGDMSLVGPRPHAVAHNELYRKQIGGYMIRHSIKPGITGLAQVNGCRGQTSTVEAMQRRVDLDRFYISNWSIGLDISILLKTITTLVNDKDVY